MVDHSGMGVPIAGTRQLRRGRYFQAGGVYFVTFSTKLRNPYFDDFWLACKMSQQLHELPQRASCGALCWVVMPDHVHLLAQLNRLPLDRVVQRLKSRSAVLLNRERGVQGGFWSKGYFDHALRRTESIQGVSDYIIKNPVRAGLVSHPGEYPFWNAAWL